MANFVELKQEYNDLWDVQYELIVVNTKWASRKKTDIKSFNDQAEIFNKKLNNLINKTEASSCLVIINDQNEELPENTFGTYEAKRSLSLGKKTIHTIAYQYY